MKLLLCIIAMAILPMAAYTESVIGGPTVVDATGSPLTGQINVNQKLYIASDITNGGTQDRSLVYIVKVTDGNGSPILLEWFGGNIDPGQTLSMAVPWEPSAPDTYTVQVFLWDGIHTQNALDATKSTTIPVS